MKSIKRAILLALLVWLLPFLGAMFIFPLRENDRVFFEAIIPVILVFAVILALVLYLKKFPKMGYKEGILLGILWMGVNILIDLVFFVFGPIQMSLLDYFKDIGVTYLLIPIITVGFSYLASIEE